MRINKFQEGGMAPEGAPVQEAAPQDGGQDQMMQQLEQMAMQIIQEMGPEAASVLAQMIMEILQSAQSQEVGAAPAEEQQFMRCGGKVIKKKCGGKAKKSRKC